MKRKKIQELGIANNFDGIVVTKNIKSDSLMEWGNVYFLHAVTTSPNSQREQKRDLQLFISFMDKEDGSLERIRWTPRLSKSFVNYLQKEMKGNSRRWSDATVNRIVAHIKTFSKWINSLAPFPLGNPMLKIKMISVTNRLEVDRALTESERRRLLDTCDQLLETGGRSKDRNLHKGVIGDRPRRKGYRPWRNRAIIYTLIETGMRRSAICEINLKDINFKKKYIKTIEKGGFQETYAISKEGIEAIQDYIVNEREEDQVYWKKTTLFLSPGIGNIRGDGQLKPLSVSKIWKEICDEADIEGKTPHSARHAMGKHIMKKTGGNVAAVQRQLGHKNAAYSLQYSRIGDEELRLVLDDR